MDEGEGHFSQTQQPGANPRGWDIGEVCWGGVGKNQIWLNNDILIPNLFSHYRV